VLTVERELDVLRCVEVALDAVAKLGQGDQVLIRQHRFLAGFRALHNPAARDVDRIVFGVDCAGDELFAETRDLS